MPDIEKVSKLVADNGDDLHSTTRDNAPTEDDRQTQVAEALDNAEAAVEKSGPDDPDHFSKLDQLACTIDDYHTTFNLQEPGRLLEAVEFAKQALKLVPEDLVRRDADPTNSWAMATAFINGGSICNTIQTINKDLYLCTKEVKYLEEGIWYGKQSLCFLNKHESEYPPGLKRIIYARRANILAGMYLMRYQHSEVGGVDQDLDNAIALEGKSADDTPPGIDAYERFTEFGNLLVIKSGVTGEVKYIDGAIGLRERQPRQLVGLIEGQHDPFAPMHYLEYSKLLCRRWQMTKTEADFQKMIDNSRDVVQYMSDEGMLPPHVSDPTRDRDVVRMLMHSMCAVLGSEESRWGQHIPTIEATVSLMLKLLEMIPMETFSDYKERLDPVVEATDLMWRRYKVTKKAEHGWAFDDMNMVNVRTSLSLNFLSESEKKTTPQNVELCALGESAVLKGRQMVSFDPLDLGLRPQRLLFLDEVKAENWIRNRNDNGTVDLGATEADVDVWEFCQNYGKGSKRQDLIEAAETGEKNN